jgi:hypothetical protein
MLLSVFKETLVWARRRHFKILKLLPIVMFDKFDLLLIVFVVSEKAPSMFRVA